MVKNRKLSNIIPDSIDEPKVMNEELTIDIEDDYVITTGEHLGRIATFILFSSKNGVRYGKFKIGTVKKYGDKHIVHELERVFYADYHTNSELVRLFTALGCVKGGKIYPERVMNIPVKFTILDNAEISSAHKFLLTDIEPIDKLPEEIDFKYVKTFTGNGYEYTPVFANEESVKQPTSKINEFLFNRANETVDFE